jgi:hypothetical protein
MNTQIKPKSNKMFIIIGVVFCVLTVILVVVTQSGEKKKSYSGPILRDLEIEMATSTSGSDSKLIGENLSKKEAKLYIYNNCDCESDILHSVLLDSNFSLDATGEVDIKKEDQWKCVKGENVTIRDYEHSYKGSFNGEQTDGVVNFKEYNLDNPIKVGCNPGEDFKTEKLKFKWNVRE